MMSAGTEARHAAVAKRCQAWVGLGWILAASLVVAESVAGEKRDTEAPGVTGSAARSEGTNVHTFKSVNMGPTAAPALAQPVRLELRGRLVCLPEEMHRLYQADLPANHTHVPGLKTQDGEYLLLLRTKLSAALFLDARLGEKELVLKGRAFPGSHILDVHSIRSVRNGVMHDLYYYCAVCHIQAVSPEPCACCQGPMELVERPLP